MDIKHISKASLDRFDRERDRLLESIHKIMPDINYAETVMDYERRMIKVSQAYNILIEAMNCKDKNVNEAFAIERAVGYLGEALE